MTPSRYSGLRRALPRMPMRVNEAEGECVTCPVDDRGAIILDIYPDVRDLSVGVTSVSSARQSKQRLVQAAAVARADQFHELARPLPPDIKGADHMFLESMPAS